MSYTIDKSISSPNYWTPQEYKGFSGHQRNVQVVVLHDTEGTWNSDVNILTSPTGGGDGPVSAHYLIDRGDRNNENGTSGIYELVSPDNIAWHCGESNYNAKKDGAFRQLIGWGNENADTVGIEMCAAPSQQVLPGQWDAAAWVIANLITKYPNIKVDTTHIIPHKYITTNRQDARGWEAAVNNLFKQVQTYLSEISKPPVPSQTFPTGFTVSGGFLDLWNKYGLEVCGFPLSQEYHENVTGIGDVTFQDFENVVFEWHSGIQPRIGAGIRKYKYNK